MAGLKLGRYKKLLNLNTYDTVATSTGNADIDISAADYTAMVTVLTITAPATGLVDLSIDLDYAKATTGVDVVATASDTLDVAVYEKVDGTNERMILSNTQVTLAGDGSVEHSGDRFNIGQVAASGVITVKVKLSAERADAEIPYRVNYRGLSAPTITAVAAA